MNVRTALPVGAFVVVALTGVWFGADWFEKRRVARSNAVATAANDLVTRTTPILDAAPAPLPTALPLKGPDGLDEEGFPRASIDQPALRSLLAHKQYAALAGYLAEIVDAFDKNEKYERWPVDAFDAFHSAELALGAELDAWVASDDASFAAHLARARYWVAVGWARRGGAWSKDTAAVELAAMHEAFEHAKPDIDAALARRPRLLPALRLRIEMASADGSHAEKVAARDAALAICPRCSEIRWTYIENVSPRWGGSYAEMETFAGESQQAASSSRMKSLLGAADEDRADVARRENRFEEAEALAAAAIEAGERWEYRIQRARIRIARGDKEGAAADLDRAKELRPGSSRMLTERAAALFKLARYDDAGRDMLELLRVDATDDIARAYYGPIRQGLVKQGSEEDRAGHRDAALAIFDIATELAPYSADVMRWRAQAIVGKDPPDPKTLERELDARPDDFRLRQRLDFLLSRTRDFARIVAIWNAYLARHPDDWRAYVERAGTNMHLGRPADAKADALKACDLGSNEGCAIAKKLGAR